MSAPLIALYGTVGTTWLRLLIAASALLLFVRPPLRSYSVKQWLFAAILGLVTATMTLSLFSAMARIPLGLAVAIDFMGPLSVATFAYGPGWRLVFPLIAFAGVLLLSHDDHGWVGNMAGIGFAALSGLCWAIYIILTQRVGSLFKGMEGLALSLSVAALVCTPFSFSSEMIAFNPVHLLPVIGLAILVPLLPFVLEMMALRLLPTSTFGILMTLSQMAGVALVVVASIGATVSS
jgi:inner membrane transporter RhtA